MFRSLIHLLGSVHFAILLIAAAAFFAIAGTVLESNTGSHLYASFYTYKHPAFLALLGFFFINILFAALKRWPFQRRHLAFLITHLGLLMILAGVMIKELYGVQGIMNLLEQSGSRDILIPHTHAIRVEKKADREEGIIAKEYGLQSRFSPFPELEVEWIGYHAHTKEIWETWIKNFQGSVFGLNDFLVFPWQGTPYPLPLSGHLDFSNNRQPWDLHAIYVNDAKKQSEEVAKILKEQSDRGSIAFIQDLEQTVVLAKHPNGEFWKSIFSAKELDSLIAYDEGFLGYGVFAEISFPGKTDDAITLETTIMRKHEDLQPLNKQEENLPKVALRAKNGEKIEVFTLMQDKTAKGLKWPALDGSYLFRYQVKTKRLPFFVHLNEARQINYPGTNKPYSFESDLVIQEDGHEPIKTTLSMNHVYETKGGYRLYLSTIASSNQLNAKEIQLAVNYDPAKYFLTYPGGALVSLGICLLFWGRKTC